MSSLEKHLQTSHNAAPNLVKIGLEEEFKVSMKVLCHWALGMEIFESKRYFKSRINVSLQGQVHQKVCAVNGSCGIGAWGPA